MVDCALGLFLGIEAEVEAQLDQVGDLSGLWVGVGGSRIHDGLDNTKGSVSFMLDRNIIDPISLSWQTWRMYRPA